MWKIGKKNKGNYLKKQKLGQNIKFVYTIKN